MTFGEKLSKARKENNYTQEQLADILGVSRQSISKWESDVTYPETDKLIRLSELFHCSLDYLLKDGEPQRGSPGAATCAPSPAPIIRTREWKEMKSKRTLWGLPLWAIGQNVTAVVAIGMRARGVIAIGMCATGLLSFGMLSLGILSFGLLSLGLLSVGCFSIGILAVGALSLGFFALGSVAAGGLCAGAVALGKYAATGDYAYGMVAIGKSQATGSLYQSLGHLSSTDHATVTALLDAKVPAALSWAKALFQLFL